MAAASSVGALPAAVSVPVADSEPHVPAVEVNDVRQDCDCGVWDNALLYALDHVNPENYDMFEAFALGADWGVTWLSAIVGMAEAIRSNQSRPHVGTCVGSHWVYPK
jgi:hypothetical protein